jgi:nucleoside phosphorylase
MSKPLILAAMHMEADAIKKALSVDVQIIGISATRLPIPLPRAERIILAGLAGALDPGLKVGDIVMHGEVHTADHLIATAEEKAELFRTTRRRAVDMENAIVQKAAEAAGIPFVGIRAVSDNAHQAVDAELLMVLDEFGRPKPLAVAGLLLRRPRLVGQLRKLQADCKTALAALVAEVGRHLG